MDREISELKSATLRGWSAGDDCSSASATWTFDQVWPSEDVAGVFDSGTWNMTCLVGLGVEQGSRRTHTSL